MATITTKGRNIEILNLTLSATQDIQLGFTQPVNGVIIKARTSVDIQLRTSQSAPDYFTIPAGTSLILELSDNVQNAAIQTTNLWIRSVSATPTVEVIGYYGG